MLRKTGSEDSKKTAGISVRKFKRGLKVAWTEVAAVIIVVFCLGFILGRMSMVDVTDKGLGEPKEIPENDYEVTSFYFSDDGRLHYDDDDRTSLVVMDVSYSQKDIDWEKVRDDGIDMAMIRLGYRGYESGALNLDAYFDANAEGSKAAGVEAGVYFFSQAVSIEEAEEEARFVIQHYKDKKLTGPIAFDMEPIPGADRITYLTLEEKTAIADAFLNYIKKKGYEPLLYGNPKWLKGSVDLSRLTDYDVWLAHYTNQTGYPYSYCMWQYTDKGSVNGITGDVDLSVKIIDR